MKTNFMKSMLFALFLVAGFGMMQAQSAYLKYTLNGVEYSLKGEQVSSYYTKGDKLSDDESDFEVTAGYVDIMDKAEYKLKFYIHTAANTKPVVGKMPIMSAINQTGYLPSVHLGVDRIVGEDYTFYSTGDENEGNFEITKINGSWIEGIFEVTIPESYGDGAPVVVKNGSFRIKLDRL